MRAAAMLLEADARRGVARAQTRPRRRRKLAGTRPEHCRRGRDARVALRVQRLPAVRHGRQRLVIDRNERGRVLGEVARLRDHDRHRLAHEGDFIFGEDERRDVGRELRVRNCRGSRTVREQRQEISEREHGMHARAAARALVSMPRIAAWACGLRTNAASSVSASAGPRRSDRHP